MSDLSSPVKSPVPAICQSSDGAPSLDWQIAGTGDFTGDDKSDILWRNSSTGDAFLYEPNGSGGFSYADLGAVPTSWQVVGVSDFNRDGYADILWRNSDGTLETWQTNPFGGFIHNRYGSVS